MFQKGIYVQLSYLYNGLGESQPNISDFVTINTQVLDAKHIFIYENTFLVATSFDITPLFKANLATMLTPDFKNYILFPTLSYSLGKNLDASFIAQYFIAQNTLQNDEVEWLLFATVSL